MRRLGWLSVPLVVAYAFLYIPIAVLVVMSFNASKTPYTWKGFSLRWYGELFGDDLIRQGFVNTIIVAVGATVIATALGTLLAIGINRYFRSAIVEAYSLAPAIIPDLALAIGLLAALLSFGLVAITFNTIRLQIVTQRAEIEISKLIGATDAWAAAPTRDPVSVADFRHTLLWLLGIDSRREHDDHLGRPTPHSDGGSLIPGLLA